MLPIWIFYGLTVFLSFLFYWVVVYRVKEHWRKYPLLEKKSDLIGFMPKRGILTVYFLILLFVSVIFGIFLQNFT